MVELLGPAEIRGLAAELDVRPTKKLGQNFVHDPNTVRRIVELANVAPGDVVLEVGPGLGSLTLGLLATGAHVVAVEIDPKLAERLPKTVAERGPEVAGNLDVVGADAMRVTRGELGEPTALVANLPYNVAVPVVLHLLAEVPSLRKGLVMVQTEVADRMAAGPGSRIYGVPSVKLAWYGSARKVAAVPRSVFWPVPNVDSALVAFERGDTTASEDRELLFGLVDAAFSQRRKTLRAALAGWAGSAERAGELLTAAGIDPRTRGEQLDVHDFARIAAAR
ncbi:dimethyladenosine transferase [Amycolatopsis mediterranei S699]|uniref:Ribosomal RNA small subunit methyltransferase A n=2 Tax=Amycolatopsis mediterranei TaxID=33910 RepID=A0A0H3DGV9_AMYMU|nr:16S rRNA (adenine(1518)-N(6)/adenine(1519)-N(6))-dimethyltransferase RsmA [Amycolatopsis mediterranei]ADJ49946.1 dimethyladenosine transferase involved in rRNA methylation [Amycolatopsis mediterranei U32]AEK46939.1 dimethyladenosine transferase [Amycolatopsis mediterranei S699]AFO81654.1 dimethyladenosine transferase [Amycolatopsis mediterranei S699]AGT88783.1 dimethyladenosine transferase [Amycolatopsis mediterranei RB]KDO07806.1 16S rRNA methyltransferase [Amycolatopsis mediterranei]